MMSNPVPRRRTGRHHSRRHNRRRNPSGGGGTKSVLMNIVAAAGGFYLSKAFAQIALSTNNTGVVGYAANAGFTAALAFTAHMIGPLKKTVPYIIGGGLAQILWRIASDNTTIGTVLSTAGMGDYQMQNFVTPQRLVDPLGSAQIEIPSGWGAPAPVAIQTAAPPGAPHPAAMSGYNSQGFGKSLYSPQGLYS